MSSNDLGAYQLETNDNIKKLQLEEQLLKEFLKTDQKNNKKQKILGNTVKFFPPRPKIPIPPILTINQSLGIRRQDLRNSPNRDPSPAPKIRSHHLQAPFHELRSLLPHKTYPTRPTNLHRILHPQAGGSPAQPRHPSHLHSRRRNAQRHQPQISLLQEQTRLRVRQNRRGLRVRAPTIPAEIKNSSEEQICVAWGQGCVGGYWIYW